MYRGRYENRTGAVASGSKKQGRGRRKLNKYFVTALLVLLALSIVGGATVAALVRNTDDLENSFVPGIVSCSVDQNFKVTNTGNVPAYIRAAIVVNWMDEDGNIRAIDPVENTDYTLSIGNGWDQIGTYYYYTGEVAANGITGEPVCTVTPNTTVPGFELVTEVVAEAIQSQGEKDGKTTKAYQDAWNITFDR